MELLPALAQGGIATLFLGIMYLVFRDQVRREREEKVFYRDSFFRVIGVTERQATAMEELVPPAKTIQDRVASLEEAVGPAIERMSGQFAEIQSLIRKQPAVGE